MAHLYVLKQYFMNKMGYLRSGLVADIKEKRPLVQRATYVSTGGTTLSPFILMIASEELKRQKFEGKAFGRW